MILEVESAESCFCSSALYQWDNDAILEEFLSPAGKSRRETVEYDSKSG
jgi:hypothetical protein